MLSGLFIAALWSPAGKGLTSLLLFVMFNCAFVTFPCGILGQVCKVPTSSGNHGKPGKSLKKFHAFKNHGI